MIRKRVRPFALALAALLGGLSALPAQAQDAGASKPAWVYPTEIQVAGRRVAVHEPVVTAYDDLTGAVSLRFPLGVTDPLGKVEFGAAEASGKALTDLGARLFRVSELTVASSAFPGMQAEAREAVEKALPETMPKTLVFRLELITARPGAAPEPPKDPPKLSNLPPNILVRNAPTLLLQIDDDTELGEIPGMPLVYVINTAADLLAKADESEWYLLIDGHWARAPKPDGPWEWLDEKELPVTLTQIPIGHPRGHMRQYIPGTREYRRRTKDGPDTPPAGPPPEVVVVHEPSELVQLNGDPMCTFIPGVNLMPVANTESDLFFHPQQTKYYLHLSGRWFGADDLYGKWSPTYGLLPPEFQQIPRDHVKGHVVWSVPGTPEAAEALARAAMRETMTLARSGRTEVRYAGKEIKTAPIDGTEAKLVTNSEDDVFALGDAYYACVRGAWFTSRGGKMGWELATELPDGLKKLPPGSAPYHVIFCDALGPVDDLHRFGFTGGYLGVLAYKGAVVHGTGWTKPGLRRGDNWYPQARTYGENRWYDHVAGIYQPRTVHYGADGKAAARLWSPYTAGYGRVTFYGDRYNQGGRRMYTFRPDTGRFDLAAARPNFARTWTTDVKARNGVAPDTFPLGDRSGEKGGAGGTLVADAKGGIHRLADGKIETWAKGAWSVSSGAAPGVKGLLEMFERIDARPAQWAAMWRERNAPVPRNPKITPIPR